MARQHFVDDGWPAARIGEVDTLEERMHAVAGSRSAREEEDVVRLNVGWWPADGRQSRDGAPVVVARRRFAVGAMLQAAEAADPPAGSHRPGCGQRAQAGGGHGGAGERRRRLAGQVAQRQRRARRRGERTPGRFDLLWRSLVLQPLGVGHILAGDQPVEQTAIALCHRWFAERQVRVAAGDQVAALRGARQRHVEQAHELGILLLASSPLDLLGIGRIEFEAEVDHRQPIVVVILLALVLAEVRLVPIPEERTEDNAVLKALGFVDGDDLDEVAVRLEAQLMDLLGTVVAPTTGQPA